MTRNSSYQTHKDQGSLPPLTQTEVSVENERLLQIQDTIYKDKCQPWELPWTATKGFGGNFRRGGVISMRCESNKKGAELSISELSTNEKYKDFQNGNHFSLHAVVPSSSLSPCPLLRRPTCTSRSLELNSFMDPMTCQNGTWMKFALVPEKNPQVAVVVPTMGAIMGSGQ